MLLKVGFFCPNAVSFITNMNSQCPYFLLGNENSELSSDLALESEVATHENRVRCSMQELEDQVINFSLSNL